MNLSLSCPDCGETKLSVIDSRDTLYKRIDIQARRRTRKCEFCGRVFTSWEFTLNELKSIFVNRSFRELWTIFKLFNVIETKTRKMVEKKNEKNIDNNGE